ncbi:unnamed protein product [Adineta steineri]|uniref:NAD(P)(+)--arginine ADP-ribosyltransferase n=3 Tax=Adineta steineri TaxID=433720 RepID=A0A813NTU0_9BILA|nr:unnamed protein product [Adineta steineri]
MSSTGDRFTDIQLENKRLPACYGYLTWELLSLEDAMKELQGLLQEINRFVTLAKRHCTYPNDHDLTKDESAAIYIYTMEISDDSCVYRILNQTLRAEDRKKVRPWFGYLKLLDSATSKLPRFKGTVFRGIDKDVTKSFKKGQRTTWWSISSCSTSVNVISSFVSKSSSSTLFHIECLNGKSIASYTCYPDENEVILMPGTLLEVVSDPLSQPHQLNIIHLKEIGDEPSNPNSSQSSHSTISTATISKNPITTDEISTQSQIKQNLLNKKQVHIEKQIEKEKANALKYSKQGNKRAAILALKKKKKHENTLRQIDGTLTTLEIQRESLQNASSNMEVFHVMRNAAAALKKTHDNLDVDQVHDLMDDLSEQNHIGEEIANAISSPALGGSDLYNDADLERELDELANLDLAEEMTNIGALPEVPTTNKMKEKIDPIRQLEDPTF